MKKKRTELDEQFLQENEELLTSKEKKKKWKKPDSDTLTVLAILSVVIIVAVVSIFLNSGHEIPHFTGYKGTPQKKDTNPSSLGLVLGMAFVSVFCITLFIIKKTRDHKRRQLQREKQQEQLKRLKELEAAKERVKQARMNEFLMAGQSVIDKRKQEADLLSHTRRQSASFPEDDFNKRRDYVRRDLNAYREEESEEEYHLTSRGKKKNFFQKVICFLKNIFSKTKKEDRGE